MKEIDARGFSCPIPVVKAKKAMESDPKAVLAVLVDEMTQVENVSRLARNRGYKVEVENLGQSFRLVLTPTET